MSSDANVQAVREVNYFEDLHVPEAGLETAGLEMVQLTGGQVLFRQGDAGDSMYILISGQIDINVDVPGGEERTLSTMEPTSILGEMSLLLDEPRTATAVARTDVRLWKVPRDSFQEATQRGDQWANRFLVVLAQVLARRLAAMNRELVKLIMESRKATTDQAVQVHELEQLRNRLFTQWSF